MTLFDGVSFFILLLLLLIPAVVLGIGQRKRSAYILVISLLMDALAIGRDVRAWGFFLLYLLFELVLLRVYLHIRKSYGRNGRYYACALMLSILPLALAKISEITPMSAFQILGISYLTFKVCQIIIEIYDGLIEEVPLAETLSFLLFFPAISSGPIDRSRRYGEDLRRIIPREEYLELVGEGLWKILLGAAYKFVFAAIFYHGVEFFAASYNFTAQVGYAYSYGLYMFFDFAGYSSMAVGASYMLGICTPDNFRQPFLAVDMIDFWNRWHITLSLWFKDFIFTRFVMHAMRGKWFKSKLNAASAAYLVDMLVMGVWHGLTIYYLLYGLYHGLLLMGTQIWHKKSKFHKKNKKKLWYNVMSWLITMQLVMFGFLLFSGHLTAGFGW